MKGWRWGYNIFPTDEKAGCFSETLSQCSCFNLQLAWQVTVVGIYKQVKGRCSSFPFLSQLQLITTTTLWPSPWFVSSQRGESWPRWQVTALSLSSWSGCVLSLPDVIVLSILPLVKPWNQTCQDQFPSKGKMYRINWMKGDNVEDYSALKEQHWPSRHRGKKGNDQEELEEAAL